MRGCSVLSERSNGRRSPNQNLAPFSLLSVASPYSAFLWLTMTTTVPSYSSKMMVPADSDSEDDELLNFRAFAPKPKATPSPIDGSLVPSQMSGIGTDTSAVTAADDDDDVKELKSLPKSVSPSQHEHQEAEEEGEEEEGAKEPTKVPEQDETGDPREIGKCTTKNRRRFDDNFVGYAFGFIGRAHNMSTYIIPAPRYSSAAIGKGELERTRHDHENCSSASFVVVGGPGEIGSVQTEARQAASQKV